MNKLITYSFKNECCEPNRFVMDIDENTINKIKKLVMEARNAFPRHSNLSECVFNFNGAGQEWFYTGVDDREIFGDREEILVIKDDFSFNEEDKRFKKNLTDFKFCVTKDNRIYWTVLYDYFNRLETIKIPFCYFNMKIMERLFWKLIYENKYHVIYNSGDDYDDLAIYTPICPICGGLVKAYKEIKFKYTWSKYDGLTFDKANPNATCSKCGRVAMPFEGLL